MKLKYLFIGGAICLGLVVWFISKRPSYSCEANSLESFLNTIERDSNKITEIPKGTVQIIVNYPNCSDTITIKYGVSTEFDASNSFRQTLNGAWNFYLEGSTFLNKFLIDHYNYKKEKFRVDTIFTYSTVEKKFNKDGHEK